MHPCLVQLFSKLLIKLILKDIKVSKKNLSPKLHERQNTIMLMKIQMRAMLSMILKHKIKNYNMKINLIQITK